MPFVVKTPTKVALPAATGPVPRVVAPSLNVTVPVALLAVSVAVRVTLCATRAGLVADVSTVMVARALTVSVSADEVLVRLLTSPPYTAVRLWLPAVKNVAENVAVPAVTIPVPSVVAPSLNVTFPLAEVPVTAAVSVTALPTGTGLAAETTVVLVVRAFTT